MRTPTTVATTAIFSLIALAGCSTHVNVARGANGGGPANAGPFAAHVSGGGMTKDGFDLVTGVTSLRITTGGTGSDAVTASTPVGSGVRPVFTNTTGQVRLQLLSTGLNGASEVDVQLSSSIDWQVTVDGGTTDSSIDLGGGHVSGVDVVGGTSHLDLTLPAASGTMIVRESGGVSAMEVHAATNVPAQVRFASGGGSATIDGVAHSGLAGGTLISPSGWATATNKYDIELDGGVSSFVLDRG